MSTLLVEWTKVYTRTGRVAHLLSPLRSPQDWLTAECGVGPTWPDVWYGTGTQDEHDRAAALPACRRCVRRAGAPL